VGFFSHKLSLFEAKTRHSSMASLTRSAKSGSDWGRNDLRAYNIKVVTQDAATFFGNPQLPPTTISPAILNNLQHPVGVPVSREDRRFFSLLDAAMAIPPGEESAVDDFAAHLLYILGYDEPDRVIRQHKDIPFYICGYHSLAKADVCVMDQTAQGILLLVQEDKRYLEQADPEAQLVAQAIAAFQINSRHLVDNMGHPALQQATIPGISMVGTVPTFYKAHITATLVDAVETGQYPPRATIIHRFRPPVVRPAQFLAEGMRPLDNRAVIIRCFEAFRQFV
jgi:hypothetical protein